MFFIELPQHKLYLENWLSNLWHHHFQYNTSFYLWFTYIFKLLHMCLNFEHKINKNKNICITIDNDKIDWYIYIQIKCASLKILECNIETIMHFVQFTWLVSPISFQLDVQIGYIFFGFKSQVEFYSFGI